EWTLVSLGLLLVLGVAVFFVLGRISRSMVRPQAPADGLAPCPRAPNCVSSLAADDAHRVDPVPFEGPADDAMARLRAAVESLPGARVVTATDERLHAEFRSALFGFVDDFDAIVDATSRRIEVRSASRVGHSDFGANRRRVSRIRDAFDRTSNRDRKRRN
ncbi:MAG: DUF1499 domain-containing protein, partial [Planctomycetota bacterium]